MTAARYRELNDNQIAPFIGAMVLQKLRRLDIENWHTALRNNGHAKGKGGIGPAPLATPIGFCRRRSPMLPRITSSSASSPSLRPRLRPQTTK